MLDTSPAKVESESDTCVVVIYCVMNDISAGKVTRLRIVVGSGTLIMVVGNVIYLNLVVCTRLRTVDGSGTLRTVVDRVRVVGIYTSLKRVLIETISEVKVLIRGSSWLKIVEYIKLVTGSA